MYENNEPFFTKNFARLQTKKIDKTSIDFSSLFIKKYPNLSF
jgi:hypothetical protein